MLRTTLVDGVRTHTLWVPKDTSAMGGTVMRGASMVKGTIAVQPHVTSGYQKVEYVLYTERGLVSRGATVRAVVEEQGTVTSEFTYNGVPHVVFETIFTDGDGLVKLEVQKTIGDGADPEPELIGLDQLDGLNANTKKVMEDASGFGLGGRGKYHDNWMDLRWNHGSGFFTAKQSKTIGQYLMGVHCVHGTGDYTFSIMGRKDLLVFQTREGGVESKQYKVFHEGVVDLLVDALMEDKESLKHLKAALAAIV